MLARQMKLVFDCLLRKEGPLAYNCLAGQDRTGFATALILSALDVPGETIIADYRHRTRSGSNAPRMISFEGGSDQRMIKERGSHF